MRCSNLARAVTAIDPDAAVSLHALRPPPASLAPHGVHWSAESDPDSGFSRWSERVDEIDPTLLVYDTLLPPHLERLVRARPRRALVLRKVRSDRLTALIDHPLIPQLVGVLVPHEKDEFGAVPDAIRSRSAFVGPIVRAPREEARRRVRQSMGVGEGTFLLTSTAGGGGFGESTRSFFEAAIRAEERLLGAGVDLVHVIVRGPHYAEAIPSGPGRQVRETVTDLVDLMAASDVVLSEGGYNSVAELRLCRTPAIFMPAPRAHDDQFSRVRDLAERGLAFVVDCGELEERARRISDLCQDVSRLASIRARLAADDFTPGNAQAALHLLEWSR